MKLNFKTICLMVAAMLSCSTEIGTTTSLKNTVLAATPNVTNSFSNLSTAPKSPILLAQQFQMGARVQVKQPNGSYRPGMVVGADGTGKYRIYYSDDKTYSSPSGQYTISGSDIQSQADAEKNGAVRPSVNLQVGQVVYVKQNGNTWREAWLKGKGSTKYTVEYYDDKSTEEIPDNVGRIETLSEARKKGLTQTAYSLKGDERQAAIKQILEAHNKARAEVGNSPLTWDEGLATYAQEWADKIVQWISTNKQPSNTEVPAWPHRSGKYDTKSYGENISTGNWSSTYRAVKLWLDEKPFFDKNTSKCSGGECGHYTAVISARSTKVGCGMARTADASVEYWVCNYDPQGNVVQNGAYIDLFKK
jgi:uncharacterized protein YkwD